jgi:hypothetical protein
MVTNTTGPTRFVDEGQVENIRKQVSRKLARLPDVDSQGHIIEGGGAATTAQGPSPASPPQASSATGNQTTLASALISVAESLGVDLAALTDSVSFVNAVVEIDATDTAALTKLVMDTRAINPRLGGVAPTMKPNPAQGSSGTVANLDEPLTLKQNIAQKLARLGDVDNQGHPIVGRIQ